ncbi:hypothetical protein D3C72_1837120 [compost metagenome]
MVGLAAHDEVHRGAVGALVQPLEERMLPVGAGHAPDGGAGRHAYRLPGEVDGFAQRLHIELLQVRRQVLQAGVVGGNAERPIAQHAPIRHAGQGQLHWGVVGDVRLGEVVVHGGGAGADSLDHVQPHRQGHRQADGRPQ